MKKWWIIGLLSIVLISFVWIGLQLTGNSIFDLKDTSSGRYNIQSFSDSFVEDFQNTDYIGDYEGVNFISTGAKSTGSLSGWIDNGDPGLVFVFHFDSNKSGDNYIDSSPNGNIATCTLCSYVPGNFLNGSLYVHTDERFFIPSSPSIRSVTTNGAFTFATWGKVTEDFGSIFDHSTDTGWSGSNLKFHFTSSPPNLGQYFYLRSSTNHESWQLRYASIPLEIEEWGHFAISYDVSSREQRIYFNGQRIETNTIDALVDFTSAPLGIFKGITGNIDESALWNRQLSDEEVAQLANVRIYYGEFQSRDIPLNGDIKSLSVNWEESVQDSIMLEVTLNGTYWFEMHNGEILNPYLFDLENNNYNSLKYRVNFLKDAQIYNITFLYSTTDIEMPLINNITVVPKAHTAEVNLETDEYTTARAGVLIGSNWEYFDSINEGINFTLKLIGLSPSTQYQYTVNATDYYGNTRSISGDFTTKEQCLVIDVCANSIDDDCNGQTDESSCISLGQRVNHWPMGWRYDEVSFGANRWNSTINESQYMYGAKSLMPADNNFGEHNGSFDTENDGKYLVDSFSPGGDKIEFDLKAVPGYNLLSLDTLTDAGYNINYTYDYVNYFTINGETERHYLNSFLIYVGQGYNKVHVIITNGGYHGGSGIYSVREQYPEIYLGEANKPRLHFDDFAPIRSRILNTTVLNGYVSRLTAGWGSADLDYNPPNHYGCGVVSARDYSEDLNMLASACIVNQNVSYCNKGVSVLLNLTEWDDSSSYGGWGRFESSADGNCGFTTSILGNGEMLFGTSLAYDMLYDYMTPEERSIILSKIDYEANYLYQRSLHLNQYSFETWWHFPPTTNNWAGVAGGGLGMAGLVLEGFSPYANNYTDMGIYLSEIYVDKLSPYKDYNNFSNAIDNESNPQGVVYESLGYTGYPNKYVIPFFHALNRIKGINLLNYGGGKLNNSIGYFLYSLTPQGIGYANFDDYYANPDNTDPITSDWHLMVSSIYNNPLALWLWDKRSGSGKNVVWSWKTGGSALDLEYSLLFHPGNTITPLSPVDAGLPLGKLFQYGRAISRTGWEENDSYLQLTAGLYGTHVHRDQGSFFYGALGNMLITERSGGDSLFHNLILVDGAGQGEGQGYDQMALLKFLNGPTLDYAGADLQIAYNKSFPTAYSTRDVFFRRGNNQYLVIFDNMKRDNNIRSYQSRFYQDENHEQVQTIGSNRYRFVGNGEVLHSGTIINNRTADIDMDVFIASPASATIDTSVPFSITTSGVASSFAYLFYPHDTSNPMQSVSTINQNGLTGFNIGGDTVLYNNDGQLFSYPINGKNLVSDGKIVFVSSDTLSIANGSFISYNGLNVTLNNTTNFILSLGSRNYTFRLGEGYEVGTGELINIRFDGVSAGSYSYYIDGVLQGVVSAPTTSMIVTVDNSNHLSSLEFGEGVSNLTLCGNGIIEEDEFCDDGALNGRINQCNSFCTGIVSYICGNGLIESPEDCDDSNTANSDGCSAGCILESGWSCSGQPSACSQISNDAGGGSSGGGGGGGAAPIKNNANTTLNDNPNNADLENENNPGENISTKDEENEKANVTFNQAVKLIVVIAGLVVIIGAIWFGVYKLFSKSRQIIKA